MSSLREMEYPLDSSVRVSLSPRLGAGLPGTQAFEAMFLYNVADPISKLLLVSRLLGRHRLKVFCKKSCSQKNRAYCVTTSMRHHGCAGRTGVGYSHDPEADGLAGRRHGVLA